MGMGNLSDIYTKEGASVLGVLHEKTGANKKYLYQIAVGLRKPSPALARKLVDADKRLTLEGLLFPKSQARPNAPSQPQRHSHPATNSTPAD